MSLPIFKIELINLYARMKANPDDYEEIEKYCIYCLMNKYELPL